MIQLKDWSETTIQYKKLLRAKISQVKKLLLIDGNNLFHRAYHALPPLTDKTGENANAVFGFSNMILKAVDEVKPTYIACAFDTKAPTFRHVEFEAYKAQRVAPPPDLYPQFPKVKGVLDAFGIRYFEMAGYEADDILASLATKFQMSNFKCQIIILSGDRDLLQLVNGDIKVQVPGWNLPAGRRGLKETTLYGKAEVNEKYGISPSQMVDWKALVGDPSDNVPGITGIGPKTASELISRYGSIESVFEHLGDVGDKVREKLVAGKDSAIAAKKLVALDTTIDLGISLDDLKYEPNIGRALDQFEKLGFKSIVAKLKGAKVSEVSNVSKESQEEKTRDTNQLELI